MGKTLVVLLGVVASVLPLFAQPVITNQPASQSVIYGGNATFGVMVTGVGPFTYQWQMNGTNLPNNIVSTLAGGQLFDGLPATNTILNAPQSAVVDAVGNLFIADMNNHVIRRVGTNGISQIVVGIGIGGFAGDGGPATNAVLLQPTTMALDTNGNLFIADWSNNRIRMVDTNGLITTVAGNGNFFGGGTVATNTGLNGPFGVAVDNFGNFYIADSSNHRIRKVTSSGSMTTIAGTGTAGYSGNNSSAIFAQLNYPNGVAVDAAGNVYIADTYNNRIRKVTLSNGFISTLAGTGTVGYSGDGGSATSATLSSPNAVSLDASGNIYFADTGNHCIRKITNGIITTVAGNGVSGSSGDGGLAISANLMSPQGVSADKSGNLYIADWTQRIRKVGTNGIIKSIAGTNLNDGDLATNATLNSPYQAVQDAAGNLFVCDNSNHRIRKIDTNGVISTFAGNGTPAFAGDGGPATNASIYFPNGVVLDAAGNLFVSDSNNRRIRKVDTNGVITTVAGKGVFASSGDGGAATNAGFFPNGVIVDTVGNLFIADFVGSRVRKVDTNGIITTVAGKGTFTYSGDGGQATNAGIGNPQALAIDLAGNLFISGTYRIRKVDTNGIISTVVGNGTSGDSGDGGMATNAQINFPSGLAVDSTGNLYLSDLVSARIRKMGTNGIITTIAGNGIKGFPVDNIAGASASLCMVRGLAIGNGGNLLFADTGANRLRQVTHLEYANQPTFTLTNATPASMGNYYSVIITSSSGSVTSSVVSVNLQLPPVTPVYSASSNAMIFTWSAISNLTYQLQSATNLVAPNWIDRGSPITATNGTVITVDVPVGEPQRFYRVQLVE